MRRSLILLPILLLSAIWHPTPTTSAEAQLDIGSGKLEIVLHVSPHDLEASLGASLKRSVRLDREKDLDSLIENHLNDHFRMTDERMGPIKLLWVGKEIELRDAWIYFEFDVEGSLHNKTLHNDLLSNLGANYIATVTLRVDQEAPYGMRFDQQMKQRKLLTN